MMTVTRILVNPQASALISLVGKETTDCKVQLGIGVPPLQLGYGKCP